MSESYIACTGGFSFPRQKGLFRSSAIVSQHRGLKIKDNRCLRHWKVRQTLLCACPVTDLLSVCGYKAGRRRGAHVPFLLDWVTCTRVDTKGCRLLVWLCIYWHWQIALLHSLHASKSCPLCNTDESTNSVKYWTWGPTGVQEVFPLQSPYPLPVKREIHFDSGVNPHHITSLCPFLITLTDTRLV